VQSDNVTEPYGHRLQRQEAQAFAGLDHPLRPLRDRRQVPRAAALRPARARGLAAIVAVRDVNDQRAQLGRLPRGARPRVTIDRSSLSATTPP
jgi:hypothetical protein